MLNGSRLYPGVGVALLIVALSGCSGQRKLDATRLIYDGPGLLEFGRTAGSSRFFFELEKGDGHSGDWELLDRQTLKPVFHVPMDDASSVWSFDGRYVARYGPLGPARTVVYDTQTMTPVGTWDGYWVVMWDADGSQLLLAKSTRASETWQWVVDAADPTRLTPLNWVHRPMTRILWFSSKKGRAIYLNDRDELVEGDLSTGVGKTLITGVHAAIVAPNGEAVAVARGKAGLSVVDVHNGNSFTVPDSVIQAPFLQVGAWSPDSQRFAVLNDLPCRLLTVDRQKHVATWVPEKDCAVNYSAYPTATYWSHDSRYVFLSYEHRIASVRSDVGVFDATTGEGKSYTIGDQVLRWLPDGTGVIAQIGRNPGRVEEYRLPPGK